MIDYRFELIKNISKDNFITELNNAINNGELKNLYDIEDYDNGPEIFNCTPYSSVFIKDGIKKIDKNIYLQSYFDNENSVNRYYDLISYVSEIINKEKS
jgi:glyceraldehyde 3-phosphate dehydrogenase